MADGRQHGLIARPWFWVGVLMAFVIAGFLVHASAASADTTSAPVNAQELQDRAAAKAQLMGIMKDPDSVKFGPVIAHPDPANPGRFFYCGSINAKNSYGGYTGFMRFYSPIDQSHMWLEEPGDPPWHFDKIEGPASCSTTGDGSFPVTF